MIQKKIKILSMCFIIGTLISCSNSVDSDFDEATSSSSSLSRSSSSSLSSSSSSVDDKNSSSSVSILINLGSVSDLTTSKDVFGSWLLAWVYTPGTDVETGFQIDRYNDTKNAWEAFDSVSVGTYRYVFNSENDGVYRVSAYNKQGNSSYSNEVIINSTTASVEVSLGTITDLSISKNVSGSWFLTWVYTSGTDVETGFQIDRYNDTKNAWEVFDSVAAGTYRYVFSENISGVYRVSAYNEQGRSSYSNELETQDTSPELTSFQKPTNLVAVRLAPSIWQLSWSFETSVNRREEGFIVEKYDPLLLNWVVWDTLAPDVKRIIIDTVDASIDMGLGSYRVAAYDNSGRSDYSNDIQVTIQTAYSADIIFNAPENIVPNVVNSDYLELMISENTINKSVEYSSYTQGLNYEVLWVIEDLEKDIETFSYTKNSVRYPVENNNELCNSYARVRVVWTDVNGIIDYSEWSSPVGSKPGTRGSSLIDLSTSPNCPILTTVGP